jgi:hypothetical protein
MQLSAFTRRTYKFKEFDFLADSVSHTSKLIDWKDEKLVEVTVNSKEISLTNNLSIKEIEEILSCCRQSLVGVGNETLLDESVRQSHEISSEQMTITPDFKDRIALEVNHMMAELRHAGQVEAHLYKFVIYGPNDFFVEHLDTPHRDLMVATLSVELANQSSPAGGLLQINDIEMPQANENQLRLALFYHDTPHQVYDIEKGYRVSLIFDVVQKLSTEGLTLLNQTVIDTYKDSFTKGLQQLLPHVASEVTKVENYKLKSYEPQLSLFSNYPHGVKIAIQASHHYFLPDKDGVQFNLGLGPANLKGVDQLMLQLFQKVCPWVTYEIAKVSNNSEDICYEQVLNIIKKDDAFKALYSDYRNDYPDYCDCKCGCDSSVDSAIISTEDLEVGNQRYQSYDSIKFRFDTECNYTAIKDHYLMGDVVFLKTMAKGKLSHKSSDEVYLGNEGFMGVIHSNVAIIFSI